MTRVVEHWPLTVAFLGLMVGGMAEMIHCEVYRSTSRTTNRRYLLLRVTLSIEPSVLLELDPETRIETELQTRFQTRQQMRCVTCPGLSTSEVLGYNLSQTLARAVLCCSIPSLETFGRMAVLVLSAACSFPPTDDMRFTALHSA